ncbi:tRNA (guanine(46)-N(7))-methyltransferase TrmB [Myceligenerans salitolerans]|uniref:tRNA (guanine-N(7)-)-methyltransferase n=1 Tax=Myceligenerans salitolerans TaxID=1230528 RepID=A0ABS3I6X3_9MICO|nr:tRNA (guanine(46)-N(7))-methyltransferase TrmB [Myceligenerans salitolerans]MBO0607847.1 tRNA (guanine(46)-N(7))-methyltransferase TrmB [Myceligenerans salitolerans]
MSQRQSVPDPSRFRTSPVSFASRSGRLTTGQQRAWDTRRDVYLVDAPRHHGRMSVDPAWRFDAAAVYGRTAPLVLEIGSGQGDAIVTAAAADPGRDYLAVEVYRPGVAQVMVRADRAAQERGAGTREADSDGVAGGDGAGDGPGLPNLRVMQVNAAELLDTAIPAGSLDEVWTFFPDPWHKSRHRKRRLVAPAFAEKVTRALRPGGLWRLATDWAEYAEQMLDVLEAAPGLRNAHGPRATAPRFEGRVVTGFERKAHRAGRDITDLTYLRD